MPNGPYCRLCGRKLVDESDQWAGRCNNDENCARRVKEQVALSTSIVDEIVAEERIEKLEAEVERLEKRTHVDGKCLTVMGSLRREAYDELIRETDKRVIEEMLKEEKP